MVLAVMFAVDYSFHRWMPTSYWFYYEDFYPTEMEYGPEDPITFISEAEIKRRVEIEWTDILRCKYDGVYQYASVYYSSKMFDGPREFDPEDPQAWVWQGQRPQVPTTCYADSTACAILPYGIEKCQKGVTEERFKLTI